MDHNRSKSLPQGRPAMAPNHSCAYGLAEDGSFKIRPYTKKELALMYFPDSQPRTAVNHLMAWINRCTPLLGQLETAGYEKTSKGFTPRQVRLIVEHLGDP